MTTDPVSVTAMAVALVSVACSVAALLSVGALTHSRREIVPKVPAERPMLRVAFDGHDPRFDVCITAPLPDDVRAEITAALVARGFHVKDREGVR